VTNRIHPLTGIPSNGKPKNGKPKAELAGLFQGRTRLTYDAARTGTDLDPHWLHADALDADSSNSRPVRERLVRNSRYEAGSNGYYDGIISTHCNMVVGVGPSLRMLTGNKTFNQLVEREWFRWCQAIQFARKLWCMAHARYQDGEAFAIMVNNPGIRNNVQLDLFLIETEQCQSPQWSFEESVGYIDGIRFDENNNILWYDVLRHHPGSTTFSAVEDPIQIPASDMLHWFKLTRPGAHRGRPALTSTLNVGATSRRHREATVKAAETAASIGAMLQSQMSPAGDDEPDEVMPLTNYVVPQRGLVALPMGWTANQMEGKHPNAQYAEFHRQQLSEQARPIAMPYNAASCDSSTYSFASGKLDTLCYRADINVERRDCDDTVCDRVFAAWFREWTILADRRDIPPQHQFDWPVHPVIDAVQEATAVDMRLKNGTLTLRQAYSDMGQDLEDQIAVMTEDYFGDASEENISKMRQILMLKNTPQGTMNHVATIIGVSMPTQTAPQDEMATRESM